MGLDGTYAAGSCNRGQASASRLLFSDFESWDVSSVTGPAPATSLPRPCPNSKPLPRWYKASSYQTTGSIRSKLTASS
eukprot:g72995.t1